MHRPCCPASECTGHAVRQQAFTLVLLILHLMLCPAAGPLPGLGCLDGRCMRPLRRGRAQVHAHAAVHRGGHGGVPKPVRADPRQQPLRRVRRRDLRRAASSTLFFAQTLTLHVDVCVCRLSCSSWLARVALRAPGRRRSMHAACAQALRAACLLRAPRHGSLPAITACRMHASLPRLMRASLHAWCSPLSAALTACMAWAPGAGRDEEEGAVHQQRGLPGRPQAAVPDQLRPGGACAAPNLLCSASPAGHTCRAQASNAQCSALVCGLLRVPLDLPSAQSTLFLVCTLTTSLGGGDCSSRPTVGPPSGRARRRRWWPWGSSRPPLACPACPTTASS